MKLKCADHEFELGYKSKKDDYKWVTKIKKRKLEWWRLKDKILKMFVNDFHLVLHMFVNGFHLKMLR